MPFILYTNTYFIDTQLRYGRTVLLCLLLSVADISCPCCEAFQQKPDLVMPTCKGDAVTVGVTFTHSLSPATPRLAPHKPNSDRLAFISSIGNTCKWNYYT